MKPDELYQWLLIAVLIYDFVKDFDEDDTKDNKK